MNSGPQVEGRVLVWDLPARVTHWGFAFSTSISLFIGLSEDPESAAFQYHILAAIWAGWFLLVRIVLGFVGAPAMRWNVFFQSPVDVFRYLRGVFAWRRSKHAGLNPGSAWFALLFYVSLVGLIWSGFVPDWVETWHGYLAYGCLFLIGAHLLGLLLHALRHRALTPLAMVHGMALDSSNPAGLSAKSRVGFALLILSLAVGFLLVRCFDPATSVISIPGVCEWALPVIQKG